MRIHKRSDLTVILSKITRICLAGLLSHWFEIDTLIFKMSGSSNSEPKGSRTRTSNGGVRPMYNDDAFNSDLDSPVEESNGGKKQSHDNIHNQDHYTTSTTDYYVL